MQQRRDAAEAAADVTPDEAAARAAEPQPAPDVVLPGGWSRRTRLRDGTRVLLRQIRPADRERLVAGLRRLSPASRYLRFHADVRELTDEQLDYLTDVDHVDHEAIVAIDLEDLDCPGIGVARYIREAGEPEVAEAAITVADEYHGQGAGTILLGALASRARRNGVRVFRNYVLAHNEAMLDVFDHLGATRHLETEGLWCVDLPIPEGEADLPDSGAGRAFLAAARDGYRLSSFFPPIWSRWRRHTGEDEEQRATAEDEEELEEVRRALDRWLADREHRQAHWPHDGWE